MPDSFVAIKSHVFDPARSMFKDVRNDRAEHHLIHCSQREVCDLYKRKECSLGGFLGDRCPYGKASTVTGPTRRAGKYHRWINDKKALTTIDGFSVEKASERVARIGEYVYLPYPHMCMNTSAPFLKHSSTLVNGQPFILWEDFTTDVIKSITTFRPQTSMYEEIKSYQSESVPKFLQHLQEDFLILFTRLKEKYPELVESRIPQSSVGRVAYVKTLKVGAIIKNKKETWVWDGVSLESKDTTPLFLVVEASHVVITLIPKEDATIKIVDDNQVDSKTKFKV